MKIGLIRTQIIALLFSLLSGSAAFAHAPVFMMAPEAPGKGAFDLHTSISHSRQGDERHTELEQEFTYGITRDTAIGVSVPFSREERFTDGKKQVSAQGIENPHFFGQFRFYNRDRLGAKQSAALRLAATLPVGDKIIARKKPDFMAGAAYGMESLKWYYMLDARYLHRVEDGGSKPGNRFFADVAVGIRPRLGELEETDTVLFLELNFMNEARAKSAGAENPDSGGSFVSLSPEILISPTNRIMIRGGVQIPIYQELNGTQEPKDFTVKLVIESRY